MKYSLATLTATLAVFFAAPLFGQPADEEQEQEQWYQVELIVFSRTENTEPGGETGHEEPALKYPEHVVEIKPAGSTEAVSYTHRTHQTKRREYDEGEKRV